MNCRVAATAKGVGVILLFPVVGKRLAGNLAACNAPSVGERRDEECVHAALTLKGVEHRFNPFIHKRNGANLYANHLFCISALSGQSRSSKGGKCRGSFQEFS